MLEATPIVLMGLEVNETNVKSTLSEIEKSLIDYYNSQSYQKHLKFMTPLEYKEYLKSVA